MRSPIRAAVLLMVFAAALPSYAYRTSAWVPSWDASAVSIIELHASKLDETNPGWYTAAADGSIATNWGAEDPRMLAAISGTDVLPTIKNYVNGSFSGELVATLTGTAAMREKHAEAIARLVVQKAYDGIDIDYERVPTTSRANFTAFVNLLASKLHSASKKLSVTVHAKTSDSANWNGPGGQDWIAIGAAADSVKIMAYDYHWSTSEAGPIAPLEWLDAIARYAQSSIPGEKVIMGLPWYGYDWLGMSANAVTYQAAMANAQAAGVAIQHDANGEATYSYGGRTVYFQDAASYQRKIEWLFDRHPWVGGFAHWRAGAEDPAIWDTVKRVHESAWGFNPVQQPQKDFALAGPSELSVSAGNSVSGDFSIVAINGWSSPVGMSARILDAFDGSVTMSGNDVIITTSKRAASGSYRISVMAFAGSVVREKIVTLHVTAPPRKRRAA